MEELLLRVVLANQELEVIDHQHVNAAELLLELHRRLAADRRYEAVHEFFCRHVSDRDGAPDAAIGTPHQLPCNGMHEMRLAETDAAVQEQWVETRTGWLLG